MVWWILAQTAIATPPLSLKEALRRAEMVNPAIRAKHEEKRAADHNILPSLFPPDPMVGYTWDPMEAPFSEQGWMVAQKFPFPLTLWERYRTRQALRDIASWEIRSTRSQIFLHVATAYADLAYAQLWIQDIQAYMKRLQEVESVSQQRYKTGRPLIEPTRFQVERLLLEAQLEQARALEDDARARLKALLDLPSIPAVEGIPQDSFSLSDTTSLLVQKAFLTQDLRLRQKRLALWEFFPSFQIQVMNMERTGMTMTQAMVTLPLFSPFKQLSQYRAASSLLQASHQRVRNAQLETSSFVQSLQATIRSLRIREKNLKQALLKVETLLASIEAGFTTGNRSYLEWLDVYGKRFDILRQIAQTQRDLFVTQARLRALFDQWDSLQ